MEMGLPVIWSIVMGWLLFTGTWSKSRSEQIPLIKYKCPEIPVLNNYSKAGHEFWDKFPKTPLRSMIVSSVNAKKFSELVELNKTQLTPQQLARARRVEKGLREGMSSYQKSELPAMKVENAGSTLKYGRQITDQVAHWVTSGFASGPFDSPPLDRFRVNCLMAVPQEGKVRPVLNVSAPLGLSFNDNINRNALEKIKMSSAREFGFLLVKCGKGAVMSKSDLCDAYKLLPVPLSELRIQGFSWLGKFFVENCQIFGASSAPCNFDQFNHTLVDIAVLTSETNPELVLKHLDDVLSASPAKSKDCQVFTEAFIRICKQVNVKLQPECEKNEKAFRNKKEGKVLGIWFCTEDLTWQMPSAKKEDCLEAIFDARKAEFLPLREFQVLVGRLNNVSLMCPFLKAFKKPILDCLGHAQSNCAGLVKISEQAKKDLLVWAGVLLTCDKLPIPREPVQQPPLWFKSFTSDAAGWAEEDRKHDRPGVATVGLDEEGVIMLAVRHTWNETMIRHLRDVDNKRFGNKTAFLEMVGILIPFLVVPDSLKKQHVLFRVDNMACVFGWEDRYLKEDSYCSIIIRAIHVLASFLECCVHVKHVPRKSDWESNLADRLTRERSMTSQDRKLLDSFQFNLPAELLSWLENPFLNWDLPMTLLNTIS